MTPLAKEQASHPKSNEVHKAGSAIHPRNPFVLGLAGQCFRTCPLDRLLGEASRQFRVLPLGGQQAIAGLIVDHLLQRDIPGIRAEIQIEDTRPNKLLVSPKISPEIGMNIPVFQNLAAVNIEGEEFGYRDNGLLDQRSSDYEQDVWLLGFEERDAGRIVNVGDVNPR